MGRGSGIATLHAGQVIHLPHVAGADQPVLEMSLDDALQLLLSGLVQHRLQGRQQHLLRDTVCKCVGPYGYEYTCVSVHGLACNRMMLQAEQLHHKVPQPGQGPTAISLGART